MPSLGNSTDIGSCKDDLFVSSSYGEILDHVAQPVNERCDLRLQEEIVQIRSLSELLPNDRHRTLIRTACGHEDVFDQVIVTTPLGWLQRNQDAFIPLMPESLTQALLSLSMSRLEKAFVHTFSRSMVAT